MAVMTAGMLKEGPENSCMKAATAASNEADSVERR
jgi:hypothetical protein